MAMAMPNAPPITNASTELYSVPQICGRTPKWPARTSQVVELTNVGPYLRIAGTALPPISHKMYNSKMIVSQANANARLRNKRSQNTSNAEGGAEIDWSESASGSRRSDAITTTPFL